MEESSSDNHCSYQRDYEEWLVDMFVSHAEEENNKWSGDLNETFYDGEVINGKTE